LAEPACPSGKDGLEVVRRNFAMWRSCRAAKWTSLALWI